jgi:hypothetical protein
MLLPDIQIDWAVHSLIKSDAALSRLAMPVLQLAAFLADTARARVRDTGRGPAGRMPQYSTTWEGIKRWQGKAWDGQRFDDTGQMWRQLRVKLNTPNRARGSFVKGRKKEVVSERPLVIDGQIMKDKSGNDIVVRRHSGGSFKQNSKLAEYLAQKNRVELLAPTDAELREFERLADSLMSEELSQALNLEHVSFTSARRARGLEARAKRALRNLARARGVA